MLPGNAVDLVAHSTILAHELEALEDTWEEWVWQIDQPSDLTTAARDCYRITTGRLIAADRFDAAEIEPDIGIDSRMAGEAITNWNKYLMGKAAMAERDGRGAMAAARQQLQEEVLGTFTGKNAFLYTLRLPTGSGKTMLAIRLALEAARRRGKKRIVYVAPYLSILSQAAREIRDATGLDVLEHHHLALADEKCREGSEEAEGSFLVLESWQAPVVATTFNQLFRALFPARAQEAMRLAALDNAFVIVDEPQIIEPQVWNPFLKMLETAGQLQGVEILLMTATMPPANYASLECLPEDLTPPQESVEARIPERFAVIVREGAWDEERTAEEAVHGAKDHGSCAVILNTVADATNIYKKAQHMLNGTEVQCLSLHGAMHPVHKMARIKEIAEALREGGQILAVTTQILEAGVDLSFRQVLRARPILPSVLQAAGRANRHAEGQQAEVSVFEFRRGGEDDTRRYVYREDILRKETDRALPAGTRLVESQLRQQIEDYYDRVFERNRHGESLEHLIKAASGKWSEVAGIEPFGTQLPRQVAVFVPVAGTRDSPKMWLDEATRGLMAYFDLKEPKDVYRQYVTPGFLAKQNFIKRKLFLNLLGRFTVNLNWERAKKLCGLNPEHAVQMLVDDAAYSTEVGFGDPQSTDAEVIFL
jgi:CRISPR-associated helicase Cas3